MVNAAALAGGVILVAAAYFLGNLSPSTIVARMHGIDIRKAGSGNPGTTNTLRTVGKKAAAITLLIDILKGVAAVLLGRFFGGEVLAYLCGTAAFLGHIWPVVYKFKGGKGIATGFGVLVALDWRVGLIALAAAVAGALISRRMSVGSIAAAISLPVTYGIFHGMPLVFWALCLAAIVIWRHRSNIVRLMNHEEPPIGFLDRKKEKD